MAIGWRFRYSGEQTGRNLVLEEIDGFQARIAAAAEPDCEIRLVAGEVDHRLGGVEQHIEGVRQLAIAGQAADQPVHRKSRLDAEAQAARRRAAAHPFDRLLHLPEGVDQRILAPQARFGQLQGIAALADQRQAEIGFERPELLGDRGPASPAALQRPGAPSPVLRRPQRRAKPPKAGIRVCGGVVISRSVS